MLPALIVVYALAVARVTRLIVADKLTEGPRERLAERFWRRRYGRQWYNAQADGADEPLPAYLITCPWCASIYVAAVAAPLAYFGGASPWLLVPALALAFSYVTGFLAGKE